MSKLPRKRKVDIKEEGERLTRIESSLEELKRSKGFFEGIGTDLLRTLLTIIVIYLLYLITMHIQQTPNPVTSPPEIKADKSTATPTEAIAGVYSSGRKNNGISK